MALNISYRARVLLLAVFVALPLLLAASINALRSLGDEERRLNDERVLIARAVAAAAEGFLASDVAGAKAIAALPAVQQFETTDGEAIERAMRPLFDAFPNIETVGLIGADGWNVRSLTRSTPAPPHTLNVSDRPYFQETMRTGAVVTSPAVLSRLRPGVPVVAIAVPIAAQPGSAGNRGVLIGTVSLEGMSSALRRVLPDPQLDLVLVDQEGQVLLGPGATTGEVRALESVRDRPAVAAVLGGASGSQRGGDGDDRLVSYAPVASAHWGVLVGEPIGEALAAAREDATRSVILLVVTLSLSLGLAWFLATRVARSHAELNRALQTSEQLRERTTFLAECSQEFARTLDYEETLQRIAALAVPTLADWCIVDIVTEDPTHTRRLAVAVADPAKQATAEVLQRFPADLDARGGLGHVIRTGEAVLMESVPDDFMDRTARNPEHLAALHGLPPRSLVMVPLKNHDGVLGAIAFCYGESSGRRYSQDDLEMAEALSERAAAAIENAQLYARAQEAVQIRNTFLAAASHDLRNPISAIKLHADLLRRHATRQGAIPAESAVEIAADISVLITRAVAQVDELLDVARLHSGESLTLTVSQVDLVHLAEQAVADFRRQNPGRVLACACPDQPLLGRWDGGRLRRVVDNLLSNAIKYSPAGGEVTVTVEMADQDGGQWASLSVRDQGVGIPASDLPHVFESFHRGRNVEGSIGGAGIGLASARQIVEAHGGRIQAESEEGKGTTVTLMLPMTAEAEAPAAEAG